MNGHYRIAEMGIPRWGKASRDRRNKLVGWCRKNDFWEGTMKLPHRRQFLHLAAGAAALPAVSGGAWAQAYPTRPVRIIVGFPAGGAATIVTRFLAQWLSDRLGQQFIIENKPGAATNVSIQTVVNSPPDGYTLLYIGASAAVNVSLFENLPFNLLRDITPVSGMNIFPMAMIANPAVPAKTVAEFIAYARDNPGKINMASFGTGTTSQVAGELFKSMTGVNMVHVPYRGEASALTDLMGGQVQVMFDVLTGSIAHIQSGALRPLGMTSKNRFEGLPAVPPIADTVAGYEASSWAGVGAPRGTPSQIIEVLNREINAGLENPTVKARLADLAAVPLIFTPTAFGDYVAVETEKWAKVVKFAGIKPE
jgi:tripartite-type tricarboxylate transporter receptor subunit TctC